MSARKLQAVLMPIMFVVSLMPLLAFADTGVLTGAQAEMNSYKTSDGLAEVVKYQSGTLSYDEATCTLTVSDLSAFSICILKSGTLTLNLEGENNADVYAIYEEEDIADKPKMSLKVKGNGSLNGLIAITGDLEVKGGLLEASADDYVDYVETAVCCANLTMNGGALTASAFGSSDDGDGDFQGIECAKIVVNDGSLSASGYSLGSEDSHSGADCRAFVMNGGSCAISGGLDASSVTVRGGALTAECKDQFSRAISCSSFKMIGGAVKATGDSYTAYYWGTLDDIEGNAVGLSCEKNFFMSGGTLTANATLKNEEPEEGDWSKYPSYVRGISCGGNFKVSGGKLTATASGDGFGPCDYAYGIECSKAITLKGGRITVSGLGTTKAYGVSCESLRASGGSMSVIGEGFAEKPLPKTKKQLGVFCSKGLTLTGGKLSVSGIGVASAKAEINSAVVCWVMGMKGGRLSVKGCKGTGVRCHSLALKKGTLYVNGQASGISVRVRGGNLKMTGGALKAVRSYSDAVRVERIAGKGGMARVMGGQLTAKTTRPAKAYAVRALSLSCKSKCIASVRGGMAKGFTFRYKGNTYLSIGGDKAKLLKRVKGKSLYRAVQYGGHEYKVR